MGMNPTNPAPSRLSSPTASLVWTWLTILAAVIGLVLIVDSSLASSATYDEVAYLRVGVRWWRTGDQSEITQIGCPLTFWKLQQIPVLWLLDHLGHGDWIDQPMSHQQEYCYSRPLVHRGFGSWRSSSRFPGVDAVMALELWPSRLGSFRLALIF